MRKIITTIIAVMALCANNLFADNIRVNKVDCVNQTDSVFYVTINEIDYKISTCHSSESVEMLKEAKTIYAITLFRQDEDVTFGDWADVAQLNDGKYLVSFGKCVEFDPDSNKIKPIDYSEALNRIDGAWYEFNAHGFGYCFADRVNPIHGMNELTILIYE